MEPTPCARHVCTLDSLKDDLYFVYDMFIIEFQRTREQEAKYNKEYRDPSYPFPTPSLSVRGILCGVGIRRANIHLVFKPHDLAYRSLLASASDDRHVIDVTLRFGYESPIYFRGEGVYLHPLMGWERPFLEVNVYAVDALLSAMSRHLSTYQPLALQVASRVASTAYRPIREEKEEEEKEHIIG